MPIERFEGQDLARQKVELDRALVDLKPELIRLYGPKSFELRRLEEARSDPDVEEKRTVLGWAREWVRHPRTREAPAPPTVVPSPSKRPVSVGYDELPFAASAGSRPTAPVAPVSTKAPAPPANPRPETSRPSSRGKRCITCGGVALDGEDFCYVHAS